MGTLLGPERHSIDLYAIGTPEMRPRHYSVKWTFDTAPTLSPPIQTHSDSGHFANKFVIFDLMCTIPGHKLN